jgi:hypothetical protein
MRAGLVSALLILSPLTAPLVAQDIPDNARRVAYGKGWECNRGYVERGGKCIVLGLATAEEVRAYLIQESITAYSGSCPCPYNTDRAGRRCGGRSAYSRPGGRSPLCFPGDISDELVGRTRAQYPPPRGSEPLPASGVLHGSMKLVWDSYYRRTARRVHPARVTVSARPFRRETPFQDSESPPLRTPSECSWGLQKTEEQENGSLLCK